MYAPNTTTPPAAGAYVSPLQTHRKARAGRKGREVKSEYTRWACAHCGWNSTIRTSLSLTSTLRETTYVCTNPECGHTFVVRAEVDRTLSPSSTPNPAVNIPLSSHIRRDMLRTVLDHAGEAEHQARYTAPVTGDLFAAVPPANPHNAPS